MKPRSERTKAPSTPGPPVRLPLVQMTVQPDGAMTVLVDGEPYAPPPYAPAWRREAFSAVLDAVTARLGTAVKVQVVEYDGTTFTDVVMPSRTPTAPTQAAPTQAPEVAYQQSARSAPVPVQGHGFVPGEDVAIAPIIGAGNAGPDGHLHGVVAADQIPAGVHEMVLVGRVSGTLQIVRATA